MAVKIIAERDAYAHATKPFNPPIIRKDSDEDGFYEEWHSAKRGLEAMLKMFGEPDAYGQADYHVGDSAILSRGIGVYITSSKPLTAALITETQRFLESLEQAYEIDYTISTRDGDFEVFVNATDVLAWCPAAIMKQLGICEESDGK